MREGGKFKTNGDCADTAISAASPVTEIKCNINCMKLKKSGDGGTRPRAPVGQGLGLFKEEDRRKGLIRNCRIKCWRDRGVR